MAKKVPYSASEEKLLSLMGREPQLSTVLRRKYYEGRRRVPQHAQVIIVGLAASLVRKTTANRERFRVKKLPRRGPYPISYWLERR